MSSTFRQKRFHRRKTRLLGLSRVMQLWPQDFRDQTDQGVHTSDQKESLLIPPGDGVQLDFLPTIPELNCHFYQFIRPKPD